jgi:hypothetical protein
MHILTFSKSLPHRLTHPLAARAGLALCLAWTLAAPGLARADNTPAEAGSEPPSRAFKFTTGVYALSGGGVPSGPGLDLNLRHSSQVGNVWLGWFRSPTLDVKQTRAGWDRSYELGPVRLMPSLQAASGGFWGGSVMVETRAPDTWYAGVGLGRTNLRNYVNLNFDPNDAWMLSAGYRWSESRTLSLQVVRDNRQNPDQQHVHLVYRTGLEGDQRLTLDLLSKSGLVNGQSIHRLGLSVGYDWPACFVRVAYDPKANFTPQDMWRVSVGTRF